MTATDADYLNAIESGDMETAQKMVDAAALSDGYDIGPVFHGTSSKFTCFETGRACAIYFTPDRKLAEQYGPRVGRYFLRSHHGRVVDFYDPESSDFKQLIEAFNNTGGWETNEAARDYLGGENLLFHPDRDSTWELFDDLESYPASEFLKEGNDTFKLQEDGNILSYAVMNADQIELADPVLYDEAGNVILLSERLKNQKRK